MRLDHSLVTNPTPSVPAFQKREEIRQKIKKKEEQVINVLNYGYSLVLLTQLEILNELSNLIQ